MKMDERREKIAEMVLKEGNVSFARLKAQFDPISEMTLRRDLEALDQAGRLIRVHGGAKSVDVVIGTDDLLRRRKVRSVEAKECIAKKAAALLRVNTAFFLDSGSTTTLLAGKIPNDRYLIFTSGLSCVQEMFHLTNAQVHLSGGRGNMSSHSVCSSKSLDYLKNVNFQMAFLGTSGFTPEHGFTCGTEDESELKRAVIRNSDVAVILMDSGKVGLDSTFSFAAPNDIIILVSDDGLDSKTAESFRNAGVTIL